MSYFYLLTSSGVYCSADSSSPNVTWSQTLSTTTASSSCNVGYYSSSTPQRTCTQNGATATWGSITNPCLRKNYLFLEYLSFFMVSFLLSFSQAVNCPVDTSNLAETWSQTLSGTTATSTCNGGYYSSLGPQRNCTQSQSNGVWGTVVNPCNGDDHSSSLLMHKQFTKRLNSRSHLIVFVFVCFSCVLFC